MKNRFSPIHVLFVLLTLNALILSACASGGTGGAGDATDEPVNAPTEAVQQPGMPDDGNMTISKEILLDPANATDADSLTVIGAMYEGLFRVEADLARALLESAGIPAFLRNENVNRINPFVYAMSEGGWRLYVPAAAEQDARDLLNSRVSAAQLAEEAE